MQLNSVGRRECVEDFLDIKVFSTMSLLAKERLRGVRDQVRVVEGDIGNLQFKIDVQKERCDEIQRKAQESTQEYKDELKQVSEEISNTRKTISRLEEHQQNVLELREKLAESKPAEKVSEVQKVIAKLEQKSERLQKEIDFYADKDDCPTCLQKIALETKNANIQRNTGTIKTNCIHIVEGQKVMDKMSVKLRILRNRDRHLESLRNSLTKYSTELFNLEDRGRKLVDKIKELENDTGDYSKESGKLEVFIDDLNNLDERKDYLVQDVHDLEVVTGLLKDSGIKTQIVRKYLPVMNNCIRRNLTELELPIHFVLDEEFNESVSSPLHQNFSYSSFSEGQKARIDLALMFTWREIGKIKNSVSTNLLILDEVFSSSLDDVGKENLLRILRYVLDDSQRVVVVDHTLSEGFKDKFDRSIQVNRVNGFSKYS